MGGAVDHLQVRRAPEGEKVGPGKVLALAPHLEQRHAVVDLGAAQEPPPGRRAAALLDAFEQAELVARRVPELPRRDAGRVPLPAARADLSGALCEMQVFPLRLASAEGLSPGSTLRLTAGSPTASRPATPLRCGAANRRG